MQINIGVGSLPAVSNRIMEIRELRPSVCLSFGGRSVLNHLRLGRGKKSLRAGRPSSDQHLEVSNVKTGGRRRIVYHHKDGSFTLHVQLGLGWDVFQNGWDGSQPLRRFVPPPPHHHHYLIFNTSNFLYQNGKSDRH